MYIYCSTEIGSERAETIEEKNLFQSKYKILEKILDFGEKKNVFRFDINLMFK